MKKIFYWFKQATVLSLLFFFGFSGKTAQAISVSPLKQTIVVNPGQSAIARITVVNNDTVKHIFVPEVSAFALDTKTGRAVFGVYDSATNWVTPAVSSLTMEPKQKADLFFTITVPRTADVSSHYFGIFARQDSMSGQVSVGTRAGSLLFLHIGSIAHQQLQWDNYAITSHNNGKQVVDVRVALKNTGTIHVTPHGTIRFISRNKKILRTFPINDDGKKVLPGGVFAETRRIGNVSNWYIGPLTVETDIAYENGQQLIRSKTIWYISPQWFWFGAVVLLSVLTWGSFAVYKRFFPKKSFYET